MKKTIILIGITLYILISISFGQEASQPRVIPPYEAFSSFLPQIDVLSKKYSNDIEIQLGIADLIRIVRPPAPYVPDYQQVIQIDPENRPANALFSKEEYNEFLISWEFLFESLETRENNAREYKREEIFVHKYDELLYDYLKTEFKTDRWGTIRIKLEDCKKARDILKKNFEEQFISLLDKIAQRQNMDTENALYNYQRAALFFNQDMKQEALREIQKGVKKKYFRVYEKERIKARMRVLEEINVPWEQRKSFILTCDIHVGFLTNYVWKDRLETAGRNYEVKGQLEKAEEIYKMAITMGEQCRKDAFFICQDEKSLYLEKLGYQALEKLYTKMKKEDKKQGILDRIKEIDGRTKYLRGFMDSAKYADWYKKVTLQEAVNQILEKGELEAFEEFINSQSTHEK